VRSASNAYFPQVLSVISIPDPDARLREAVGQVWDDFLQYTESADDVARERRKEKVHNALGALETEAVWREVQRRKRGLPAQQKSVKQAELEMRTRRTATSTPARCPCQPGSASRHSSIGWSAWTGCAK
jgi:hypothetical protein